MAAVKEKSLSKIQVSVVYIPSPLKRETISLLVKMDEKCQEPIKKVFIFGEEKCRIIKMSSTDGE
jgi:hypothetical protein